MKKIPILHIVMFLITAITTIVAGALQKGIDPLDEPGRIIEGLPFAVTLLLILLAHEGAHYIASRKHGVKATLPFFIPAPSIIGTFGAFIKMRSPIRTREALVDIGASGPIAGFIVSVVAVIAGLLMSKIVALPEDLGLYLGDSLLFSILSDMILGRVPEGRDVLLHPVAFAGWIGFFVTSMNLIPVGQLDGGHIAYALFGEKHRKVSFFLVGILVVIGIFFWQGWLIWSIILIIMGVKHPPFLTMEKRLENKRRIISLVSFIIFVITFIPAPFRIAL